MDDLQRIRFAAATKESAEFKLDHAKLDLEQAIIEAADHGQDPAVIADVAEVSLGEVIDFIETLNQPPVPEQT